MTQRDDRLGRMVALVKRHRQADGMCVSCFQPSPCDLRRFASEALTLIREDSSVMKVLSNIVVPSGSRDQAKL